jgi:pyruvate dehydrogenase E1 component alpha subunit
MPIAVGLAFAAKYSDDDTISIAFTGDGAADEGAYYEALNLATLLSVPVLFVCENNHLSTNTLITDRQAQPDAAVKASAFGLRTANVDGRDVFAVYDVARALIEKMRSDRQPALLQVDLARLCAHVGPVPTVAPIDADAMIAQARSGTFGDDPISNCLASLVAESEEVAAGCRRVLEDLPALVRAEFGRASSAFQAYNEPRHLVAPPPPRSYAV